jgi:hypothetical protein
LIPGIVEASTYTAKVIFKAVGDARPYPEQSVAAARWSDLPPRQVRLADLITTKRVLDLEVLLAEDSTYFGDLFAHVVLWKGQLYLEDGLHRALRAALAQRPVLHARVLDLDGSGIVVGDDPDEAALGMSGGRS